MTKYFAFIDGSQQGPFDLRQLIDAGVRPSTYVWSKEMDDWKRADTVPEICELFRNHLNHRVEMAEPVNPQSPSFGVNTPPAQEQIEEERPSRSRMGRFGVELPPPDQDNVDINSVPQTSLALAILSFILCFPITGVVAIYCAYKTQKLWIKSLKIPPGKERDDIRSRAHDYARLAKMWLGITVAFGLIFWTLLISIFY